MMLPYYIPLEHHYRLLCRHTAFGCMYTSIMQRERFGSYTEFFSLRLNQVT